MASRPRQSMGSSISSSIRKTPARNAVLSFDRDHPLEEPITQKPFSTGFWVICSKTVKERRPRGPPPFRISSNYLTSTFAPASSSFFLRSAASALETASLTAFGAPSTRSLASLRPRPVIARTSLMTLILFAPASVRMTSNSVFLLRPEQQRQQHHRQQQRLPEQRRKRPTFLREAWKAQQLPGRSARRGLQRSLRDQPFYFSFCSVRTGFKYNSEIPPQAASSFLA